MSCKQAVRLISSSSHCFKKVTPTKSKGTSSHLWLSRQLADPYVEKAKQMNLRCRSAFKLMEIDDRFKLLKPGHFVVDCGAAPGSWTQVAVQRVNADAKNVNLPQGKVISIDKQQIFPIEGAILFGSMDFTNSESQNKVLGALDGEKVNVVISDMAPKATGVRDLDNENIIKLCYAALRFALQISKKDACVLVKLWQCGETKKLENDIARFYNNVNIVKPKSSRSDSTEIFLLGREFKGLKTY